MPLPWPRLRHETPTHRNRRNTAPRTLQPPPLPPALRIHRHRPVPRRHNHRLRPVRLTLHRRRCPIRILRSRPMPQLHPSLTIDPRSETVRIILNLRHHHPASHHRRRRQPQTVPSIRIIHHQPPQPHKVPLHIQTDQIVRRKQRIHMLPIRTRRRRSIARLRMTHRPPSRPELPLPDQLPIPIPETQHMQPLLLRPARRRHKHPTPTHQRRRQPSPRQRRLPRHPVRTLKRPRRIAPLTSIPTRTRPPEL